MKKHILLLILTLFALQISSTYAQQKTIEKLKNSYQKGFVAKGKDSLQYQKAFFDAFPSDFKSLSHIYGWNDLTNKPYLPNSLNGDAALDHINHFFKLTCINDTVFIKKIIEVSINAKDQADGISFFQHNLIDYVPKHSEKFLKVLKTFNSDQVTSVWVFYFDYENSFARKGEYNKIVKLISPINKNMIPLITIGYQKSTKWWKDSH